MESLQAHPVVQHVQSAISSFQRFSNEAFKPQQKALRPSRMHCRPQERAVPARVNFGRNAPLAAILPGDGVVEQVFTTGMLNFLNLYNSALIARLVLTWFPNPPEFIAGPLSTLCDPYLNLFRGIIPPLGGTLDFSPILAFVTLSFFTNAAAALPAELGPDQRTPLVKQLPAVEESHKRSWQPISRFQRAWARRVAAAKQRQQQA